MEQNQDQNKQDQNKLVTTPLNAVEKMEKFFDKFIEKENIKKFLINTLRNVDMSIDYIINAEATRYERNEVLQAARSPLRFGGLVVGGFFLIFGSWATLVPLDEASHAQGYLVSTSNKKPIQHLEGGIIKEIYVKDGDTVKAGDKLLLVSHVKFNADFESNQENYYQSLANLSRLMAQRDNLEKAQYPKELTDNLSNPAIKTIYDFQENLFHSTMNNYSETIKIYEAKIESAKKTIEIFNSRTTSGQKQLAVLDENYKAIKKLADQGYASKIKLGEAERQLADAHANLSEYQNKTLASKQDLLSAQATLLAYRNEFSTKTEAQIQETQGRIAQFKAAFTDSKDRQDRQLITSPIDGVVHDFFYVNNAKVEHYAVGSVINQQQQNSAIMNIIPVGEGFEVEAKVQPSDIDVVQVGMTTKMDVDAFRMRYPPPLIGKVIYVSEDVSQDNTQNGQVPLPYYSVRIQLDKDDLAKNPYLRDSLKAGMRLNVSIISGGKTMLRYLLDPLRKQMKKSFSER